MFFMRRKSRGTANAKADCKDLYVAKLQDGLLSFQMIYFKQISSDKQSINQE